MLYSHLEPFGLISPDIPYFTGLYPVVRTLLHCCVTMCMHMCIRDTHHMVGSRHTIATMYDAVRTPHRTHATYARVTTVHATCAGALCVPSYGSHPVLPGMWYSAHNTTRCTHCVHACWCIRCAGIWEEYPPIPPIAY